MSEPSLPIPPDERPVSAGKNQRWHLLAVAIVAAAVGLLFLGEPGLGDDLTYWSFAFDLHERGFEAWQKGSFHDLRWPVWGVCWLFQALGFSGVVSFYAEPLLYLALGAVVAFVFGHRVAGSIPAGWACGLAFVFHPLLDTVCDRPMPDLSEGVWSGVVLLGWWATMQAPTRGRAVRFAALTGLALFVLEANRITGVLLIPLLVVITLAFYPRKFGWLLLIGAFSALGYVAQAGFYHWLFGDWLHDLHANLGNKEAKGTEFPNAWLIPFRFLDSLWAKNGLGRVYCLLAALGCWAAWRRPGVAGRLMVLWFGVMFLAFSCAPQSLSPYRPLIRDAERFLAAIAIPMSVLAALGLAALFTPVWLGRWRFGAWWPRRPVLAGALATGVLIASTGRPFFDLGFVPEMRRYMAALPDGTRIFSHKAMREMAALVDHRQMRRLTWTAPNQILHRTAEQEAQAAQSDEFWYVRKLVWLSARKSLERKKLTAQPPLASYFAEPDRDWQLAAVLAQGNVPDLVFARRRTAATPEPRSLGTDAAEWQGLLPALPATWNRGSDPWLIQRSWKVPAALRNQLVRLEFDSAAEEVEAFTLRLRFSSAERSTPVRELLLKPYLYPSGGVTFFALHIPADAETCEVQMRFARKAQRVDFESWRVVIAGPPVIAER